jgi:hypothetical protein
MLAVYEADAQPVDLGRRDIFQARKALVAVNEKLALQDFLRRRPGQPSMRVVRPSQQSMVDARIFRWEAVAVCPRRPDRSVSQKPPDQARDLRPRDAAEPPQVGVDQTFLAALELEVIQPLQDRFDPDVALCPVPALERDFSRAFQHFPNLFQRGDVGVVHDEHHGPRLSRHAGSSRLLQAHFA